MCNQLTALSILREAFASSNNVFENRVSDAYLYGSFARGDYHEYSDVDILVTVNMNADEISDYRTSLAHVNSELSLKHDVTVSITVKPLEHFQKYSNVLPCYPKAVSNKSDLLITLFNELLSHDESLKQYVPNLTKNIVENAVKSVGMRVKAKFIVEFIMNRYNLIDR